MFPENKHLETFLVPNKKEPEPPSPIAEAIRVAISITIPVTITLTLFETLAEFNNTPSGVPAIPTDILTESSEEPLSEDPSSRDTPGPIGPPANPDGPNGSGDIPSANPNAPNGSGDIPSDSLQRTYPNGRWIRIPAFCNGFHADAANFRISPSLHASAIKGIVLVGNRVFLTGERRMDIDGNGITWHRAFNELPLEASQENVALNNILSANQEGWIADCFVE